MEKADSGASRPGSARAIGSTVDVVGEGVETRQRSGHYDTSVA